MRSASITIAASIARQAGRRCAPSAAHSHRTASRSLLPPAALPSASPPARAPHSLRTFTSSTRRTAAQDPGGKPDDGSHPNVYDDFYNMLEDGTPPAVQVKSISDTAFTLVDGLVLSCPSIFLNGTVLMWDAPPLDPLKATPAGPGWEAWDDQAWKVFEHVAPKPEILIFGTGQTVLPPPPRVRKYLNSLGIQVDAMDSRNACSTYNLLSEEGRRVAAALLPNVRQPIKPSKAGENVQA